MILTNTEKTMIYAAALQGAIALGNMKFSDLNNVTVSRGQYAINEANLFIKAIEEQDHTTKNP